MPVSILFNQYFIIFKVRLDFVCVSGKYDQRPFRCGMCQKAFPRHSDLLRHVTIHNSNKYVFLGECPFKCGMCDKTFTTHIDMFLHVKTHSLDKFFFCDVCPKKFYRSDHLKKHEAKFHAIKFEWTVLLLLSLRCYMYIEYR